jgi:hypothetical protein
VLLYITPEEKVELYQGGQEIGLSCPVQSTSFEKLHAETFSPSPNVEEQHLVERKCFSDSVLYVEQQITQACPGNLYMPLSAFE